jgi:hypothetical protein
MAKKTTKATAEKIAESELVVQKDVAHEFVNVVAPGGNIIRVFTLADNGTDFMDQAAAFAVKYGYKLS